MRDAFAHWICGQPWVWGWAEKRGSRLAVRVARLCLARAVGYRIRWAHLVGHVDITAATEADPVLMEGSHA